MAPVPEDMESGLIDAHLRAYGMLAHEHRAHTGLRRPARQSVVEAVADTLRTGWLTLGPRTQEFEAEFAEHLGVPHAIAMSSCTSALHLAYLAAGVGPGDEVIVPGITFVATAAAARYCGAEARARRHRRSGRPRDRS